MRTKLCAALIATAMGTGVFMAALTAVTPDVYHDMNNSTTVTTIASTTEDSAPSVTPDVYHDM